MAWQGVNLLPGRDINQHAACDDRGYRGSVAFSRTPIASPDRLFETIVPVVIGAGRDVGQAVDLGRHVVGDEHRRRVPVDLVAILIRRRRIAILHPANAVGAAKRDDLSRAVPRPLVAAPAVRHAQVEDLAPHGQLERFGSAPRREPIQGAYSSSFPQIQPQP